MDFISESKTQASRTAQRMSLLTSRDKREMRRRTGRLSVPKFKERRSTYVEANQQLLLLLSLQEKSAEDDDPADLIGDRIDPS